MAIEISERFCVEAPIDVVWRFVKDPQQMVTCLPGATLDEVVGEREYLGSVKVKLGAVTTNYKGRVEFAEVDEQGHSVRVIAKGREAGGGTASGTLSSTLSALPDGQTEVIAEGDVDLTGRVMQVGRGMIQGVSRQLFKEFAASTKQRLETSPESGAPAAPVEAEPIRVFRLFWRTAWSAIRRFFRRVVARLSRKGKARNG